MFDNVVDWFLGRAGDRRQYKRRGGAFHLWWQPNPKDTATQVAGIGMEISPNGLMFIIEQHVGAAEYQLVIRLRDRTIPVRVKTVRSDRVEHQGKTWNRYMAEITGIAADDWDAVVRYVNDQPDPDRRKMQNQEMHNQVDDAYRMLPLALQKRIVDMLVSQHKLEPPKDGKPPLLKLFYGGLIKRAGQPAHRFNVHSRVMKNDEMVAYDTRLLVSETGEITQI